MRKFLLLLTALMLLASTALAKNVTVSGEGMTASEAENKALQLAVEDAIGVLVDAQTIVSNYTLISNRIYTQSRGFITNYTVVNRYQQADGVWTVTINADVDDNPNSKLMNELTRLGIIDNRLRNPKIAVYIPEQHLRRHIPDPAGETAVVKALLEAGFSNVIEVGSRMTIANPLKMTANDMTAAARQFGADIMIVGEAFSESVGDAAQWLPGNQRSGMQACRARVEAKLFIVKSGQMIAADGKIASGIDVSEAIAAKKALSAAGNSMGEYLIDQLLKLGSGNRQSVELIVRAASFDKVNLIQSALNEAGINFNLSSYETGIATFDVRYGGTPQALFNDISPHINADLTLQSVSYNQLTIQVR